jgi:TP901 family phage tail tape measure protein
VSVTTVIYSLIGVDGASPAFEAAGASADKLDSKFGKLGKAAGVMSLAIAAAAGIVAVESVKAAVTFQASMEKIHTQAGASQASVESLTKSVLKLAPSAQQGPQQLSEALYHLKSLGMDNAAAMKALATSSNLAAVGGSNLEDTATAIGAAWRSGIKGGKDFTTVASTVNAIIGAGNMKMGDFVESLSPGILPAARTWGVSLSSVGSAMALMTDEGVPAIDASTRLRMTLSLMGHQAPAAAKALASIGLGSTSLATAMQGPQGIIGAVQLLKTHLDDSGLSAIQSAQLLSQAFGGGRSSSTILTLLNNLGVLKQKQDQINKSMGKYGPAVIAQRKTAAAQFDLLKSAVATLGIKLGLALLPPVTQFAGYLNKTVIPDVQKVIGWLTSPDVKPWAEIAGKLILAAAAATAIYSGLKKAAKITGLDKIFAAKKTPAESATTAAAANMGTAGDTMYQASLNMLKAAGIDESEAAARTTTTGAAGSAVVGASVGSWFRTAAGGALIGLIVGNIAGMIANAVHPASRKQVQLYQNAVPGYVQAVSNTMFGGPQNTASLLSPVWNLGAPRTPGVPVALRGLGAEPVPGAPGYAAYQAALNQMNSSKSGPVQRVWSTAYEDFQRDFAGRITAWFTKSLPDAFTHGIPARIWSPAYQGFQRDFAGKLTSWFTQSLPAAFTRGIPARIWSPAYQGFQRDFGGPVKNWLTGSLPHFFTGSIPRHVWSPVYQWFQRDVAGKITSWFTKSLPHGVSVAGTTVAKAFGSGFTAGKKWVTSAAGKAGGWIAAPFKKAGTWLYQAGASVIDGLVSGIESKAASPLKAIENVGSGLISKFKSVIHSKSPSKVFYQLGTSITAGLTLGINETAAQAQKAAASLAAKVTAAYSAGQITGSEENSLLSRITTRLASDLSSLGKAKARTAAAKLGQEITARIGSGITETIPQAEKAAKALAVAINRALAAGKIGTSQASQLLLRIQADITSRKDRVVKALKTLSLEMKAGLLSSLADASTPAQAKSAVNKLIGYVKAAWSAGAITTSKASKLTSWLEKDSAKLQSLAAKRAKIAATIAAAEKYATDTAANVASGAQLTNLQSAAGGTITGSGIVSGLLGQLAAIKRFAADIKKLKSMGLGKALLGQVIDAGPVQGDQLAQAFISSGVAGIKQANAAQAAITKASTALGRTAADVMFDSGKQAGKGFLSGLKAQQAAITKLMIAIAKSMVKTLKKELGIKSPSTVTHQIGEFTGIGIEEGLLSRVRHVEGAAKRLAVAAVPAPRPGGLRSGQTVMAAGGGEFTGTLYLDSGELLGVVRGEIRQHDKKLLRRALTGTGLNG